MTKIIIKDKRQKIKDKSLARHASHASPARPERPARLV
jgi:hypothetical protein